VSWLLAHSVVASVIAGASSAQQLAANARAANWHLTAADLEDIDAQLRAGAVKAVTAT
jgi:aryl-alcohol dehydrogenase-like predicted oxidoreductase